MLNRNDETVTITTRPCMMCNSTSEVRLTSDQAEAIAAGTLIQEVVPQVEPTARELLISGTHPTCWAEAFD